MRLSTQKPHEGVPEQLVFTKLRNTRGTLTKSFIADPALPTGKPISSTRAALADGEAVTMICADLAEFVEALKCVSSSEAFAYGVTGRDKVRVVTRNRLPEYPGAISRDREHFRYRSAPGIWMLDHDAGYLSDCYDDAEHLRAALFVAIPALEFVPMVWASSASAYIYNAHTGQEVKGPGGARIYIPVADASDIPRAQRALLVYLWAAGLGTYTVSRSGQLLDRSLFDMSTAQPERLDFVAGAKCEPPLEQRRPKPRLFEADLVGGYSPICTRTFIPDPGPEILEAAQANRRKAQQNAEAERQVVRAAYLRERMNELTERGVPEDRARETVQHALDGGRLFAEFLLHSQEGVTVTVGEVLNNPSRWHAAHFADPLEPTYGNDPRIARANLRSGGRPFIHSFAHGGQRYELCRQPTALQVNGGDHARLADVCIDLLREQREVFDGPADGMLRVAADGRLYPVIQSWLQDHLGRIARFERFNASRKSWTPVDPPPPVTAAILAREGQRGLAVLNAVVTAPIILADGTIIDVPGYHEASGMMFVSSELDSRRVPLTPTDDDVLAAFRLLWEPIAQFPYDGPASRGVALAALFTAVVRPALPTAPAFAIDAPQAGTGKTLLARAIAALAGSGGETSALPVHDDERRKMIFAMLRNGRPCITFDNVASILGGEAFDQAMTAPMYQQRVLSESRTETVPNRALVLLTGNNFKTIGDTNRRVLRCRIDAKIERPYGRQFAFNPAQMVQDKRQELAVAVLTLIQAHRTIGGGGRGSLASFEDWDTLVRQPVMWLARLQSIGALVELADPVQTIDDAEDADDSKDLDREVIRAWHDFLGEEALSAKTVLARVYFAADDGFSGGAEAGEAAEPIDQKRRAVGDAIRIAVRGTDRGAELTSQELGGWLRARKGIVAGGLRLESAGHDRNGTTQWCVRVVEVRA